MEPVGGMKIQVYKTKTYIQIRSLKGLVNVVKGLD